MNVLRIGLIVLALGGCAQKPAKPETLSGICAIQPIGHDGGVIVAMVQCEAK